MFYRIFFTASLLALCSCSPRIVEVERPVVVEHSHTATHTDIVRDTLIMRDSVYHYAHGDTIIIERWHHVANVTTTHVTDTIRDTIPHVTTITRTEVVEVPRPLSWWQRAAMWMGAAALVLGAWRVWKLARKLLT